MRRRKLAEGIAINRAVDYKYAFMPLISHNVNGPYIWPKHGFGRPTQCTHVTEQLTKDLFGRYWYYDWHYKGLGSNYIPMVYKDVYTEHWAYNDGRPILLFNEPERADQSNLTVAEAVKRIRLVQTGLSGNRPWKGPIWVGGCQINHVNYMLDLVNEWRNTYNVDWPCTGWHVHVYNNNGDWKEDINKPVYVNEQLDNLELAKSKLEAADVFGQGFVISEYGALTALRWHGHDKLLDTMCEYEDQFVKLSYIKSWAWFSSYSTVYPSSNLVISSGVPTILGSQWREIVSCSEG